MLLGQAAKERERGGPHLVLVFLIDHGLHSATVGGDCSPSASPQR